MYWNEKKNEWNENGGFCMVWIGDALLGFPKEISYVGNPLWCDHTHHIQNT